MQQKKNIQRLNWQEHSQGTNMYGIVSIETPVALQWLAAAVQEDWNIVPQRHIIDPPLNNLGMMYSEYCSLEYCSPVKSRLICEE